MRAAKEQFLPFWTASRLLGPALLWLSPVWGFLINVIYDVYDGELAAQAGVSYKRYQDLDKWFDLWFYVILALYIALYWGDSSLQVWLLGFFVFRLLGGILFSVFNKEILLVLFPDVFTVLTFFAFVTPSFAETSIFLPAPLDAVLIAVIFSVGKEWWIHVAKIDTAHLLLGVDKKWSDQAKKQ